MVGLLRKREKKDTPSSKTSLKRNILMKCDYGAGKYTVENIDLKSSPYYGLYPKVMSLGYLPYYPTIDDPVIKEIAAQLNRQLEGRDDRVKATVVLSMIQQNIKYTSDEEIYGLPDVWGLPATVLSKMKGDCDCMSNLYVSIAHNMGLDVVSVTITGHMFPAVCFEGGHGKSYEHNGKTYFHMEVTDELPAAGRYWSDSSELVKISEPKQPSESFRNSLKRMNSR